MVCWGDAKSGGDCRSVQWLGCSVEGYASNLPVKMQNAMEIHASSISSIQWLGGSNKKERLGYLYTLLYIPYWILLVFIGEPFGATLNFPTN